MIYLASPYTHERADIRALRYRQALYYCRFAMEKGETIFSPVVYGHPFVAFGLEAIPYEYWQPFNEHMILASCELRILKSAGWQTSRGIRAEVDLAERHGIKVTTAEPLL